MSKEDAERVEEWHLQEKKIMYDALKKEYGDKVDDIIAKAVGNRSYISSNNAAKINGSNTLEDFVKLHFGGLISMGWEYTVSENIGEVLFNITKCPKYDLAKKLGAEDIMYLLACETDEYSAKGFNENIQFSRSKTLMKGDECCNHCYRMQVTVK
jgi:hypothetical protein